MAKARNTAARVRVELFGLARITCGRRYVDVDIDAYSDFATSDVIAMLAEACPALVGKVIREDLSALLESYIFNLNGTEFVSGESLRLKHGDRLLLFSSQAGG